ncbi:hypothetical protein OG500_02790 [Kitasatospora sp. NBC_01250]|uniref:hypothetical protein n=1 Tax=unclassified Kitasatospora TaxID=2633591 RepID=UPI002E0F0CE9|nr:MULTISPECIES: hypothetical protein [unclassified Kitasatospora]WSJ65095.1 hypothetical protein OG294_02720 [Kitasatospora sp. NBC_01302]
MAGAHEGDSDVVWSEQVGRELVEVRRTEGRCVLRIGGWSTVLNPETRVHHESKMITRRITVGDPGRPPFVYRYRLPWRGVLAPALEATYDRWSAEADDPGLRLVDYLGGTDDWVPRTPSKRERALLKTMSTDGS